MKRLLRLSVFLVAAAQAGINPCLAQDAALQARQLYNRGKIYYEQGDYKRANEEFERSLQLLRSSRIDQLPVPEETALPGIDHITPGTEDISSPADVSLQAGEYYIGTQDILFISVWQNDDLTGEAIVRPDGKISLPLVGDIQAASRTIPDLDREITAKLAEFIRFPEVSISIRKIGGQRVMVLGEVMAPGVYDLTGNKSILEAVSMAHGFTRDAVVSSVIVVRGGLGNPQGIRLDLNKPLLKADMSQNILLQPEDIVYVPKKFIANVNYFVTQLIAPIIQGSYTIADTRRQW